MANGLTPIACWPGSASDWRHPGFRRGLADHPLFRDGVRALLNSLPATEVVGEASTGAKAVAQAEALQPDVILMDILMPDLNGIEATRQILRTNPAVGILMLTMFEDDESVLAAMRVGARGYILKGADQVEIWHAIQAVARGEALFGPAIARRLSNFFSRPSAQPQPFPDLTEREPEILDLMAQGYSNAELVDLHLDLAVTATGNRPGKHAPVSEYDR